jgi:hypothetical protein
MLVELSEKAIKINDLLEKRYTQLHSLGGDPSSVEKKKQIYKFFETTLETYPNLHSYWKLYPNEHFWKDRVKKISIKSSFSTSFIDGDNKFQDEIDYWAPSCSGLYFLGETHFNPFTKEEYYWVKIGSSSNLRKRLRVYNTCNPMCFRIGFLENKESEEFTYHKLLAQNALAQCNHNDEWFMVDRETYLEMCEKGFDFFS